MKKGFSLIEIAIVLVVLALVVSVVIVGKDLIRSGQHRAMLGEIKSYSTAINIFKNKMGALPGDLYNAKFFWPAASNGNRNGRIDYQGGLPGEEYETWRHLMYAQLIPGNYTAVTTSIPESAISKGYYRVSYQTSVYMKNMHLISLNAMNPATNTAHLALLSPKEVYGIDLKADDGLADKGSIMGFNEQGVGGCVTNDYTDGIGDYLTTSDAIKCKVFFEISD